MMIRIIYRTIEDNIYLHKSNKKHIELRLKNSNFDFGKNFYSYHLFCLANIPMNCNIEEYYNNRTVITLYCKNDIPIRDIFLR